MTQARALGFISDPAEIGHKIFTIGKVLASVVDRYSSGGRDLDGYFPSFRNHSWYNFPFRPPFCSIGSGDSECVGEIVNSSGVLHSGCPTMRPPPKSRDTLVIAGGDIGFRSGLKVLSGQSTPDIT